MQPADVFILQRIAVYSERRYRSIGNARQIIQAFAVILLHLRAILSAISQCHCCNEWLIVLSALLSPWKRKKTKNSLFDIIAWANNWTYCESSSYYFFHRSIYWATSSHFRHTNYGHEVHSRKLNWERFLNFDSRFLPLRSQYWFLFSMHLLQPSSIVYEMDWRYWFNHFDRKAFESNKIKFETTI